MLRELLDDEEEELELPGAGMYIYVILVTLPIEDKDAAAEPLDIAADRVAEAAEREGSVEGELEVGAPITATTVVEPLRTPTTLIRDVSVMLRRAQTLLMNVVMRLLSEKNCFMSIEKCVVSCKVYESETTTKHLGSSVITKWVV
jgi:hypothetical protein